MEKGVFAFHKVSCYLRGSMRAFLTLERYISLTDGPRKIEIERGQNEKDKRDKCQETRHHPVVINLT